MSAFYFGVLEWCFCVLELHCGVFELHCGVLELNYSVSEFHCGVLEWNCGASELHCGVFWVNFFAISRSIAFEVLILFCNDSAMGCENWLCVVLFICTV